MPNYVFNHMTVTGPEADRERFMRECFTPTDEGPQFDFNRLIPQPDFPEQSSACVATPGGVDLDFSGVSTKPVKGEFRFPAWYEWRCEHWGDKWNAHDTEFPPDTVGGVIRFKFDTAWAPPIPIFRELAKRFPELNIKVEFDEGQMNFAGEALMHGGKVEFKDTTQEVFGEYYAAMEGGAK